MSSRLQNTATFEALNFSDLSRLVLPRSIALIGASDRKDSIGGRALLNLMKYSDFMGRLDLVNPTKTTFSGPAVRTVRGRPGPSA